MQDEFGEMARNWESEASGTRSPIPASVTVDLVDEDDELVLTAELPGFDAEDIDVRVTDHTLRLEAEQDTSERTAAGEYITQERRHASAMRSISLPAAVETDAISAEYDNGILTVRMPKSDPVAEGTEIEIN